MLILTRRVHETIMIAGEVRVTVLAVNGTQVRLGIDAPKNVVVHREEVYDRIQLEPSGPGPGGAETPKGSVAVRVKKSKLP